MKQFRFACAALFITAMLYKVMDIRYGLMGQPLRLRNLLIIALVSILVTLIHHQQMGKRSLTSYGTYLLAGDTSRPGRICYMDWLRVLATVLVVSLHVIRLTMEQLSTQGLPWKVLSDISSVFAVCNVLFVLISGALILNGKEEPIFSFYKKKLINILVPCFLYFAYYSFYVSGLQALAPSNWSTLIREFLSNDTYRTPHFWLVHVIIMFYVAAPFLSMMTRQMKDSTAAALALVILLAHGYFLYGPYAHLGHSATTFLGTWDAVFLLGYFCTTKMALNYRRLLTVGSLISLAFIFYAVHSIDGYESLVFNNAPPALILGCTIFLFFRSRGDGLFSRIPLLFSILGKYSFSILMIHWLLIVEIVRNQLGISGIMFGSGLGMAIAIPLTILATLVVSTIFAVVFDNTFVLCTETVIRRVLDRKVNEP